MTIHVIPVGGTEPIHHASSHCWCKPFVRVDSEEELQTGITITHHARDGREKWERQLMDNPDAREQLAPNSAWVNVFEGAATP